jgi:hypothetical protein
VDRVGQAKADWIDPLVRRSDPILDAPEPEAPSFWHSESGLFRYMCFL